MLKILLFLFVSSNFQVVSYSVFSILVTPDVMERIDMYNFVFKDVSYLSRFLEITFIFAFNFKEINVIKVEHFVQIPLGSVEALKYGEFYRQNIVFPQLNNLTFDGFWARNFKVDGSPVFKYVVVNKKGVKINGKFFCFHTKSQKMILMIKIKHFKDETQ